MDASLASVAPSFLERVAWALERVSYRRALNAQDRELVYRMRYIADARQNLMQPSMDGRIFDKHYDSSTNNYNIMTFLDDKFVSTCRIHVDSGQNAILPSLTEFDDVLTPLLRDGRVVLDLSRIAAKLEYARKFPELPYLTIRAAWLAAEHFGADFVTLTCFAEHQAFYTRVFGFESLCLPRVSPQISRTIACMALDYRANKERVENRYPLFRSTEAERQPIFGPVGGRNFYALTPDDVASGG